MAEGRAGSSSTDTSWALPCSLGCRGHYRDGHSTVPPLPIPRQVGGALPWPCQPCPQPFAITPRVVGEAGHKQSLCLRPYYKTQVTPLLGSRNKANPPHPPAQLCGLEGSHEPCGSHLAPSLSRGSGGAGSPSCLRLSELEPSLPLQVTAAPPNLTITHCRSAGRTFLSPSPLLPQPAAAETFPVPFLQDSESHV